ncbi:MAG: hypothetical protein WBH47_06990 [Streptosporangiaceae bacterium]
MASALSGADISWLVGFIAAGGLYYPSATRLAGRSRLTHLRLGGGQVDDPPAVVPALASRHPAAVGLSPSRRIASLPG